MPAPFNPARRLAVNALVRVRRGDAFAATALDEGLSKARLEPRDAGLATHLVYGVLRHHFTLTAALAPLLRGKTPDKAMALLLAGAFEKLILGTPPHAVVNEYVSLAKAELGKLSGLANAVLRRVEAPEVTPETEFNLPAWLVSEFEGGYGEQAEAVMRDFLTPAPLWLWTTDSGARALEDEGALLEPGVGDVLKVVLGGSLRASKAWREGGVQPINPASYAVTELLGDVKGRRVLDLAGGSGVKAAMLTARGARVTSLDVDARKHKAAEENFKRLNLQGEFRQADLRTPPDVPPADLVLLDAPCTGTGTLRAHPEIKLRLTPTSIAELAELQRHMLESAATVTSPGGTLVYSVCSVTDAEGPAVVRDFLRHHADFESVGAHLTVPSVQDDFGARTLAVNGIDGFYTAKLRRL
ncbi:RsmB/NOP family class I SAM-dependent RNA methyltransferase [Deinococcus yavapaiensis]|uniref:16S rRNA (Cytosine967-C5)-methyltransferase n=1 Tax=Deinococcus yavapaiensis KR-236 TaxID=694435 RepID=A0A318S991_9DEIO|nr:transcription antitermination factor NusB [Deinococcus yavapaiensis]PYE53023.1 16S rRNA (cytosine967-C5)-methyltransferase [Deinococcus yavapaiensis KR-236]